MKSRITLSICIGLTLAAMPSAGLHAQVTTDGTTGPAGTLSGPATFVPQSYGTVAGDNLFHSFSAFSVADGESVTFGGNANIQNVIARVTGNDASAIAGLVDTRTFMPRASFFLLNPNGVIVSGGGRFSVGGALYLSTADKLGFADGSEFLVAASGGSTLSVSAPESFGFIQKSAGSPPASVEIRPGTFSGWSTPGGLIAIAGAVTLADARDPARVSDFERAVAPTAGLYLGAVGNQSAEISLSNPAAAAYAGKVTIDNVSLLIPVNFVQTTRDYALRAFGGDISVSGSNLAVLQNGSAVPDCCDTGAQPSTAFFGEGVIFAGRGIQLHADNTVRLTDTKLHTDSFNSQLAGAIDISARSARLERSTLSAAIGSRAIAARSAFSPGITIAVTDDLVIADRSLLNTSTLSSGNGAINLSADALLIDHSTILGEVLETGYADGGDVSLTARTAKLDGAIIRTSTSANVEPGATPIGGDGTGGDIRFSISQSLDIVNASQIRSDSSRVTSGPQEGAVGGNIIISASDASVQIDDSQLTTSTRTRADGGQIRIDGATVAITGNAKVQAATVADAHGQGGSIAINADDFLLAGDISNISTSSLSFGSAGNITITSSGDIRVHNGGKIDSAGSGGRAGSVELTAAGKISFLDRASILTTASTRQLVGPGGGKIRMTGSDIDIVHSIFDASTSGTSDAGLISLTATSGSIDITNSILSTEATGTSSPGGSSAGGAGEIALTAARDIRLSTTTIRSQAFGQAARAGTIALRAAGDVEVAYGIMTTYDGSDSVQAPGTGQAGISIEGRSIRIGGGPTGTAFIPVLQTSTGGTHDGGTVSLKGSESVTLSTADVLAVTQNRGRSGGIDVQTPALSLSNARLRAFTSGTGRGGVVTITAGAIDFRNFSFVETSSFGLGMTSGTLRRGDAGDILVDAGRIFVDNTGGYSRPDQYQYGATAFTSSTTGNGGNAGSIRFVNPNLDMTLINSSIDASTIGLGNGGSIAINAKSMRLINSEIAVTAREGTDGGFGYVQSRGDAGNIDITTDSLVLGQPAELADRPVTGSNISSSTQGLGKGGQITIRTSNSLAMYDRSRITAASKYSGAAGNIRILAPQASTYLENGSGIETAAAGAGNAGDIDIESKSLRAVSTAFISSATSGGGGAGRISILSDALSLQDTASVSTQSEAGAGGAAGQIRLAGGTVQMSGQSRISSATSSTADAGKVEIDVTELVMTDSASVSTQSEAGARGTAGEIAVSAAELEMNGSARITSATRSDGDAGRVNVDAGDIRILGTAALSTESNGGGAAGAVTVNGRHILVDGGEISSRTAGAGGSGSVQIGSAASPVSQLDILNGGRVITSSGNSLQAGQIAIFSDRLYAGGADSGVISENVGSDGGAAGTITVASPRLTISDGGFISTNAATGSAGNINLTMPETGLLILSGETDPGVITTSSGPGTGGVITISRPLAIVSNGGSILALGEVSGANVAIHSGYYIRSTDRLNRLDVNGILLLDSDVSDVSRGLDDPEVDYADASKILVNRCSGARASGKVSQIQETPLGPYINTPCSAAGQ